MKHLRILSVSKDPNSITPSGDFRLRIRFEITGSDGSDESKVLFFGQYRPVGSPAETPGIPIFSEQFHLVEGVEPLAIMPAGNDPIPFNAEVSLWGIVDTDYKPYNSY